MIDFDYIANIRGERLTSKRNAVFLIKTGSGCFIKKQYADTEALNREASALALLGAKGVSVPKVLHRSSNCCILEYLPGCTYVELTEKCTKDHPSALRDWFDDFYRAVPGKIKGDVNLRNFLYSDGKCFGVDFEEPMACGEPETDIGRLLAYFITYDPAFTLAKQKNASLYLTEFLKSGYCMQAIRCAFQTEIENMAARRGKSFCNKLIKAYSFFDRTERTSR